MHIHHQTPSILQPSSTRLEVVLLPGHTLLLALADNLLAEPLRLKAALQGIKLHDNVGAAFNDRILGCHAAVRRDTEFESREQWMRDFVCGEDDVVILEEALGNQVTERVVFFVEGEDASVGDAWGGGIS
jgi:hypothetical protein